MKQTLFLLLCLLLASTKSMSSHIVGGEMELRHLEGYTYRISLIMYYDYVNTTGPGNIDSKVTVRIFDKRTNRPVADIDLPLQGGTKVEYTNPECTINQLGTRRHLYTQDWILQPGIYNSPDGYYMTWERCCRNDIITNIINPEGSGQAYYLEFPAVSLNNTPFVNSSPRLFPPLSDYACVNELFYYDFSGIDDDGDSLVYDMVTPLNGFTSGAQSNVRPEPSPAPYPEVKWRPGFDRDNQVLGSPPLRIDAQTGRLTVRPNRVGLFVFSVRIQEFRKGKKIGEVRRDFQMLVIDCPRNESPVVQAKAAGQKSYYKRGEILHIRPGEPTCIDVVFTDPDPNSILTLKAEPINFSKENFTFSGPLTGVVNSSSDSLRTTVCFEQCFTTNGQVYKLNLIVQDNACSLPRLDTLEVNFIIDPIPNGPPEIGLSMADRVIEVKEGDQIDFDVLGFDADNDEVTVTAKGVDFDLRSLPIRFENRTGIGQVSSPFGWQVDCAALAKPAYQIEFTATSLVCGEPVSHTEIVEFHTVYPNRPPVFSTDQQVLVVEVDLGQPFEASFLGTDEDQHRLSMAASVDGHTLADLGMVFTSTSGAGAAEGKFSWVADCSVFEQGSVRVTFLLKEDACAPSADQSITLEFRVRTPDYKTFNPPNIFTPNGDGLNDFFEIPGMPADVCTSAFQHIRIYNRWGKEVYASTAHDFRWDGKNVNEGVYYYVIDYGAGKYKGSVTLVR